MPTDRKRIAHYQYHYQQTEYDITHYHYHYQQTEYGITTNRQNTIYQENIDVSTYRCYRWWRWEGSLK